MAKKRRIYKQQNNNQNQFVEMWYEFTLFIAEFVSILAECAIHLVNGFIFGMLFGFSLKTGLPTDGPDTAIYVLQHMSAALNVPVNDIIISTLSFSVIVLTIMEILEYRTQRVPWKVGIGIYLLGTLIGIIYAFVHF
jgi:hypothetical protein